MTGNDSDVTLNIDWDVEAAALFGRQRSKGHHQATGYSKQYEKGFFSLGAHTNSNVHALPDQSRSRSVMVLDVGAFAGISVRYADAGLSLGYRGDFFFNAMDNGVDTRNSESVGFFGPFAAISIGLGG